MSTNDNTDALPPLEQQIDEYIDGYTLEGDDGYYTPNDTERLIAKDVVMGLLAEPWFVAALAAQQGAQVPQAPFLFVAMDDDKRAHLTWCADEAAVREAVKGAMFWLPDGEELDAENADQLTGVVEALLEDGAMTFEGDAPLYLYRVGAASPQAPAQSERRVECDACPTSLGCVGKCMKAAAPAAQAEQERPALVTALRGLLASLHRQPTEFELRAAAHEFTVQADRIAAGHSRREDGDG